MSAERIERTWMKEPCGPCPYSRSKTLWLHPERASDFAYNACNPYSDFPCHKTADLREDEDGSGSYVQGARSLTCNGFLSLQCNENDSAPSGFEPHPDAFGDHWEMIEHHQEHWDDERLSRDNDRNPEGGKPEEACRAKHESVAPEGIAQPQQPQSEPSHES